MAGESIEPSGQSSTEIVSAGAEGGAQEAMAEASAQRQRLRSTVQQQIDDLLAREQATRERYERLRGGGWGVEPFKPAATEEAPTLTFLTAPEEMGEVRQGQDIGAAAQGEELVKVYGWIGRESQRTGEAEALADRSLANISRGLATQYVAEHPAHEGQAKELWEKAFQAEEAARRAAFLNSLGLPVDTEGINIYMGDWEGGPAPMGIPSEGLAPAPAPFAPVWEERIAWLEPLDQKEPSPADQAAATDLQADVLGVQTYLQQITPTKERLAAGWDPRGEAMERGMLSERKRHIEEHLQNPAFSEEYRKKVREYLTAAETYEGTIFTIAAIPERRNYWQTRIQMENPEMAPSLAATIVAGAIGVGTPTKEAQDLFGRAIRGEFYPKTEIGGRQFTVTMLGPAIRPGPGTPEPLAAATTEPYPERPDMITRPLAEWSVGVQETIGRGAARMEEYGPAGALLAHLARGGSWPVTVPAAVTGAEVIMRQPAESLPMAREAAVGIAVGTVEAFKQDPLGASVELGAGVLVGYGIGKGLGFGYERIQPRVAELGIMARTPPAEWRPTHAAVNIYQTVKGLETPGASTPDLAMVESIRPGAAPVVAEALAGEPHAIFGRATEIGQMPKEWIAPRGYTYDVDVFMASTSEARFTSRAGELGAFDIHGFPENYPIGVSEPIEGYAARPAINPLPRSRADLLFTRKDPFAAVEVELRGKTGLFSRESAVIQRPTGEIVPVETVRRFGAVDVIGEYDRGMIDWHTHPADIFSRVEAAKAGIPVNDLLEMPSPTDMGSYAETGARAGVIVTPEKTLVIRPGKGGYYENIASGPTMEIREPVTKAEISTGLVAEKLRIQAGRKVASILGEETEGGGWQIGPPIHRLKDVYDTMRYASYFATEERAAGGPVSLWKAGRLEKAALDLQAYYGNPENLGRFLPQDVAIYGQAIREFELGKPAPAIPGPGGEPVFRPPPGYRYPTDGYPDIMEGTLPLVPSPSPSSPGRGELFASPSPSPAPGRYPSVISVQVSRPLSPDSLLPTGSGPALPPPSEPLYTPPPRSPGSQPPYSPPTYGPPYSPPTSPPGSPTVSQPPYSPPSSPPTRFPPSSPPFLQPPSHPPAPLLGLFGDERRRLPLAEEEYVNWMEEVAPTARFEEAFTVFRPPREAPLPLVKERWNVRYGALELLPPPRPGRLVGLMKIEKIELPTTLFREGTGEPIGRIKNRPFFRGLI